MSLEKTIVESRLRPRMAVTGAAIASAIVIAIVFWTVRDERTSRTEANVSLPRTESVASLSESPSEQPAQPPNDSTPIKKNESPETDSPLEKLPPVEEAAIGTAEDDGSEPPPLTDEEMADLLIGRWEAYRGGQRKLLVSADGTAEMDVQIETKWKWVFGSQIRFFVEWTIEDGHLKFQTTGGEPQVQVDAVVAVYGTERSQKILKMTEQELILEDLDGDDPHEYSRVLK